MTFKKALTLVGFVFLIFSLTAPVLAETSLGSNAAAAEAALKGKTKKKDKKKLTKDEVSKASKKEGLTKSKAGGINQLKKKLNYGLTYNDSKDHLEDYTSKAWFGNDVVGLGSETLYFINSLVQAAFWPGKMIFKVCAAIYSFTSTVGTGSIDDYIGVIIGRSSALFYALLSSLVTLIGGVMVFYAYARHMAGGSFFGSLFKSFVVYGVALLFFSQIGGQYMAQTAYEAVSSVATESVSSLNKAQVGYSTDNQVLDSYFIQAIWKPYVYMNAEVKHIDDAGNITSDQVTTDQMKALRRYKSGDDKFEFDNGTKIGEFVGSEEDVKIPMLKDAWGQKFAYAFGGDLDAFFMGAALVLLGLMAFVLKLVFLFLLLFAPFILVMALIPTFENILVNFFKNLFGAIALSLFVGFFATLFLYFYSTLTAIVNGMFSGNYFAQTFFKGLVLWVMWRQRDRLIKMLTVSRASGFMDRVGSRIRGLSYRNPIRKLSMLGAGVASGYVTSKALDRLKNTGRLSVGAAKHTAGLGFQRIRQAAGQAKAAAQEKIQELVAHRAGKRAENRGEGYQSGVYRSRARQKRLGESLSRFKSNVTAARHSVQGHIYQYAGAGLSDRQGARSHYADKAKEHLQKAKDTYQPKSRFAENYDRQKRQMRMERRSTKGLTRKTNAMKNLRGTVERKREEMKIKGRK